MGRLAGLIAASFVLYSCAAVPPRRSDRSPCDTLDRFVVVELGAHQQRIDVAFGRAMAAQWRAVTGGGASEEVVRAWRAVDDTTNDDSIAARAQSLSAELPRARRQCPPVAARFERAAAIVRQSQRPANLAPELAAVHVLEARLTSESNAFRIPFEGQPLTPQEVQKQLAREEDRARRRALFDAGEHARGRFWLEHGFRELLHARNRLARAAGYPDFDAYGFAWRGIDRDQYFARLAALKRRLAPRFRDALLEQARRLGLASVEPWDVQYLKNHFARADLDAVASSMTPAQAFDLALAFYDRLGIAVPLDRITLDLLPRAGKNGHAATYIFRWPGGPSLVEIFGPHPPVERDVAFFSNLRAPLQWNDVELLVHELGHCIHALSIRQPVAYFRPYDLMSSEALGVTLQRLAASPRFLTSDRFKRVVGDPLADRIARTLPAIEAGERLKQSSELLGVLFATELERAMYADPDQDFDALAERLGREYWGSIPTGRWDSEHFLSAPVYLQNYVIGMLLAEDVSRSVASDDARWGDLGRTVVERFMAPGREKPFGALATDWLRRPLDESAAASMLDPSQ